MPANTGGDDLDDLELEADFLASASEGEDVELDVDAAEFLSDEEEEAAPASRKRSRDGSEKAEGEDGEDKAAAKKRRREKDKARRAAKRAAANGEEDVQADPSALLPEALAALLLASARAAMPKSSPMEIEDVTIPASKILPPVSPTSIAAAEEELKAETAQELTAGKASGKGKERATDEQDYAPLVARLNEVLKNAPKKPTAGTPRVLILSLSGIRCADVVRAVRGVKRPGGEVAKLFAKHFKLADQIKYLSNTRVAIAVGTPARVAKLLAEGALKLNLQSVVLFDVGHRDSKKRTLLTLPEVRNELWTSLLSGQSREALRPARYAAF